MTKKTSLWQRLKNAFSHTDPASDISDNLDNHPFTQDLTGQMIVDLAQNRSATSDPTLIDTNKITADDIEVMLASMGYHFSYHPPKDVAKMDNKADNPPSPIHHFSMQVSDGDREWGCLLRFFEKEQLLAVYSIFSFTVPASHRGEMLAVIAYLNYDLVVGNLELDVYDGELRFKTSLDLEVTGLSHEVLVYLLQSNFAVTSRLYDTLAEVMAKSTPAQSATEAVDNLLLAQQANTFYLMTDTVS